MRILLPFVVLALAAGAAFVLIQLKPEVETTPPEVVLPIVRTETVQPSGHEITVSAQGSVQPHTESELVVEVSGRVVFVSPKFVNGGFFEESEELLRIDDHDYRAALRRAELELAQAERRVAEEEADALVALQEWQSMGEGDPTPLVLREPHVREAQASEKAAQAAVERAERDLERTVVRAPYAGRVRRRHIGIGQYVMQGTSTASIYAVDYAEVRLPLPDAELEFLDLALGYRGERDSGEGLEALLTAEFAGRRHTWPARLVRTEGELDPKSRMVIAVARVENPYGRGGDADRPPLAVGMFVDAEITGRRLDNVFVLPRQALRAGNRVYVVDDEDRLRIRSVELERAGVEQVVVSTGLNTGDRVVTSPLEVATDGMRVRERSSDPADPSTVETANGHPGDSRTGSREKAATAAQK